MSDPPGPSTKDMETLRAKKPSTRYDDAVTRVQEWNEALNGEWRRPETHPRLMSSVSQSTWDHAETSGGTEDSA